MGSIEERSIVTPIRRVTKDKAGPDSPDFFTRDGELEPGNRGDGVNYMRL